MFLVNFIMNDGSQDQEYWYQHKDEAEYHFHLFDNDDSDMYFAIELFDEAELMDRHVFNFTKSEMERIIESGITDQTDLCMLLKLAEFNCTIVGIEDATLLRYKLEQLSHAAFSKFISIFKQTVSHISTR